MISINNLKFAVKEGRRGTRELLRIDSLEIKRTDFVLIKGETGAGKSTLLSLIGGMNRPTEGEVNVLGRSISKLSDRFLSEYRREGLGFLFQFFHLIDDLSVIDNISLPLVPLNLKQLEIDKRVQDALKLVGLFERDNSLAKSLSGGERQKCSLARALIHNPPIVIADEPTANLDIDAKKRLIELLNNLNKNGKTILVVSHDPLFEKLAKITMTLNLSAGRVV